LWPKSTGKPWTRKVDVLATPAALQRRWVVSPSGHADATLLVRTYLLLATYGRSPLPGARGLGGSPALIARAAERLTLVTASALGDSLKVARGRRPSVLPRRRATIRSVVEG